MEKIEKLLAIMDSMKDVVTKNQKQCPEGSYNQGFCQGQLDILQLVESLVEDEELLNYLYGGKKNNGV